LVNGSTISSLSEPSVCLIFANSLAVTLSKTPIDQPSLVLPENYAAPKIVEFCGV
jgi:hypothetical protein